PSADDVGHSAADRLLGAATGAARGQTFGSIADGGVGVGGGTNGGSIGQLAGALGALRASGSDITPGLAGTLGRLGSGGPSSAGAPTLQGMAAVLLAGIYPTLKPLLEGAIRKVTVAMHWYEGSREFSFDVVQYVTNPGQALPSGETMDALERAAGGTSG